MDAKKHDIQKEIIESRFKRTLIHCPNPECGAPIGERLGNTWWYVQYRNGRPVKAEHKMDLASGSSYRVECTKCGYAHIFAWIEEAIHIKEELTIKLEKE